MSKSNGIEAMPNYAERVMKVRIPIDERVDWLRRLEAFRQRYGRKLDPVQVDRMLHEFRREPRCFTPGTVGCRRNS
jgi:hypothetical protein